MSNGRNIDVYRMMYNGDEDKNGSTYVPIQQNNESKLDGTNVVESNVAESNVAESNVAEYKLDGTNGVEYDLDEINVADDTSGVGVVGTENSRVIEPKDETITNSTVYTSVLDEYYKTCDKSNNEKVKTDIVRVEMDNQNIALMLPDLSIAKSLLSDYDGIDGIKVVEMIHNRLNDVSNVEFSTITNIKYDPNKLIYRKGEKVKDDVVVKNSLLTYLVELYELLGNSTKKEETNKLIIQSPANVNVDDYLETDSALVYLTELSKCNNATLDKLYKSILDTQITIVNKILFTEKESTSSTINQSGGKKTRRNKKINLRKTFKN